MRRSMPEPECRADASNALGLAMAPLPQLLSMSGWFIGRFVAPRYCRDECPTRAATKPRVWDATTSRPLTGPLAHQVRLKTALFTEPVGYFTRTVRVLVVWSSTKLT